MAPKRTPKVPVRRDWKMDKDGRWTLLLGEYGNSVRITQRKPGGMFVRTVHLQDGRKAQGSLHTSDREEARARAEAFYWALIGLGEGTTSTAVGPQPGATASPGTPVTLGEIWVRYKKEGGYQDNCETTRKDKDARAEILLAGLGADTVAAYLTPKNVDDYRRKRRAGHHWTESLVTKPVRARSVEADLQLLRAMLLWATQVRDRQTGAWLLDEYPLRGLKLPKEKNPRRVATTFERFLLTREACRRLAAAAYKEQGRRKWLRVELAVVLAEATGRRIGAIAGLRWEDITLEDSPVWITWREEFDKDATLRVIEVTDELARELAIFRWLLNAEGDEWLFPNQDGSREWSNDLFDQGLRDAEKHAGLPPLRGALWHAYRRKWVTERKAAGWSLVDIAAVGGWKSVEVLEKCYALEDVDTMRKVMAEPRKLQGPITGVVKNSGKIATPQGSRSATGSAATAMTRRSVA